MLRLMGGVLAAFVFGLITGSFLNVVIVRFDDWLSIVKKPSHCPSCKAPLTWRDLIPLVSYIHLRGKCRYCAKPISWQYPLVELITACLFAAGFYLIFLLSDLAIWQQLIAATGYALAVSALIVIFFHDLYEMMIPDVMSNVLLVGAALFSIGFYLSATTSLFGALIGFLPVALLVYPSNGRWMGEGDVKLSAALGLMVGYPAVIVYLAASFVIGGLFGAVGLLAKLVTLKTAVPFAPFLIIGALLALFFGGSLIEWYLGIIGYGYY